MITPGQGLGRALALFSGDMYVFFTAMTVLDGATCQDDIDISLIPPKYRVYPIHGTQSPVVYALEIYSVVVLRYSITELSLSARVDIQP